MRLPPCTTSFALTLALVLAAADVTAGCAGMGRDAAAAPAPAATEQLAWSDEFDEASSSTASPSPRNWVAETGGGGWGNHESEVYCAPASAAAPCDAAGANAFVASDGMLHILARRVGEGAAARYTSARLKSQGLQSFQYGRLEARIRIPGGAGIWPAFWMLGDDIVTRPWPACGEIDIMESIGAREPGIVHGTLHGTGFPAAGLTGRSTLPAPAAFSGGFHTFGAIWSPGRIAFYVDDAAHPYAAFTTADLPPGAVWPFDSRRFFFLLNVAVGGDWPGPPDPTTPFPAEMLVDYVRVYRQVPPPTTP